MFHPTRFVRALLILPGLALLAGACSDELVAPHAAPDLPASLSTQAADQPTRVPNAVKYRDSGARPATGRSGAATLSARALLGKDGATQLEVAAGVVDGAAGPATLEKLQVKHFAADGSFIRTVNHNAVAGSGRETVAYGGLGRGARLQVQGNVRSPQRTGVVTVTETVHLRPDLRASLDVPGQVVAGLPLSIAAAVTEGNGEVGARADCVLLVDGAEVDRAGGIWVDAGGVVSCAFAHTFADAGTHVLRVEVSNVDPGDFDDANNAAEATVQVTPAGNDFYYHARVEDVFDHSVSTASGRWEQGNPAWVFIDHSDQWTWDIHFQEASLWAWLPYAVTLPLTRIAVSGSTGGGVVHQASYTGVSGSTVPGWESVPDCAHRWNGAGAYLIVCVLGAGEVGLTSVSYMRVAGDVTYHSQGVQEVWFSAPGDGYTYTFNYGDHYTYGDPTVPFGDDYAFSIALTDGDRTWNANVTVPLGAPETYAWTPYPPSGETCGVEYYDFDQVFRGCRTYHGLTTARRAEKWGSPD